MAAEHLKGRFDDIISRPQGESQRNSFTAPPETDSELPDAQSPYQAFSRVASKAVYTLHCCLGKGGCRSFQYKDLDSDSVFKIEPTGHVIVIRFEGTSTTELTIRGRNLWKLYDYLHQHRMPWIMKADRDFPDGDDKQPIITGIAIERVEREEE
jgi:hypothetical protein